MKPMLNGVRIVDMAQMLAGGYGSMLLGDLGAEMIKIEQIEVGDRTRLLGPPFVAGESGYFLGINRNKKSVALDVRKEQGRQVLYDLARVSDVVFHNFRPGVMERLQCDYDTFKEINPRIIYCGLTGYGEKFWQALCRVLEIEELIDDPRFCDNDHRRDNREELVPILEEIFRTRPGEEWLRLLSKAQVPCGPINTLDRLFADPQVAARNMVVEMEHPTVGRLRSIGNPVKTPPMDEGSFEPPPLHGQHTDEVLHEILGYSVEHITQLRENGVVSSQ